MRGQHPERMWTSLRTGRVLVISLLLDKVYKRTWKDRRAGPCQISDELPSIEAGVRGRLVRRSQSAMDERMGAEVGTPRATSYDSPPVIHIVQKSPHLAGSTTFSNTITMAGGDTAQTHKSLRII